jgi:uncharacterized protein
LTRVDLSGIKSDYRSEMMRRDINGKLDGNRLKRGEFTEGATTILGPLALGKVSSPVKAPNTLKSLGALPEISPMKTLGARAIGEFSRRPFDPNKIGIPIRNLTTENIKITPRGIDFVERHLFRFGKDPANEAMVKRLRSISGGKLQATQQDLNFYSHELRESVRYKNLGFPKGVPQNGDKAWELWNNTHTSTLEDYKIKELPSSRTKNPLYHPDATKFFFEDFK